MKTNQTNIETFEQLISFIENNNISISEISKLCKETIDLYIVFYSDKAEVLKDLKQYWIEYGHLKERPIFLNATVPFDIKQFWNDRLK
jgi:predicted transcriptional regulator